MYLHILKKKFVNSSSEILLTFLWFVMVSLVFDCSPPVTWFDAQTICRNMNQTITLIKNESKQYYWTGLYERQSHWIKIIGILIKQYVYDIGLIREFTRDMFCMFHYLITPISPILTENEPVCLLLDNEKNC